MPFSMSESSPTNSDGHHRKPAPAEDWFGSLFSQQLPRSTALLLIAGAATLSVLAAWLQISRQAPQKRQIDPQAAWVEMADRVKALKSAGRYGEAIKAAETAVRLAEQAYGPDHPAMAESLNELGQQMVAQSRFEGVERMYQRSLAIQSRLTGSESPEAAHVANNLAQFYEKLGRFEEAAGLYEKTLAIHRKAAGNDADAGVALALNNIACLEDTLGNHEDASKIHRQALAIREALFGPGDIVTAESYGNLSANARERGDLEESERYQRRALSVRERTVGPTHPLTAASLSGMARLLLARKETAAADPIVLGALAIQQKAFGPGNNAASTLETLALIRGEQGDQEAARRYAKQALTSRLKANGPKHPRTATTMDSMAALLAKIDAGTESKPADGRPSDRDQAAALLEQAVEIRAAVLGAAHPKTIESLRSLADLYKKADRKDDAAKLETRITDALTASAKTADSPPR